MSAELIARAADVPVTSAAHSIAQSTPVLMSSPPTLSSPVDHVRHPPSPDPWLKRALDIALAASGLLVSLPVSILIALAVKLQDGGPIFYRQVRVGRHGQPFTSWKFRSMVPHPDAGTGARQATADDARITRVGRLLRVTALDELPQLWSILVGDMSFVGPRALLPAEIETYGSGELVPAADIPGYAARHQVTPGLTGVAQIYADRDIPRRHKFRYDLVYVRRRSVGLDLRLIALSLWITLRGKWEHRGDKLRARTLSRRIISTRARVLAAPQRRISHD
ncbi:MAG TPA: sugar transferase [Candidatus Acidoferrum sp.]|nr:sugar transferase [Candidatus Acidoferrum sp.]